MKTAYSNMKKYIYCLFLATFSISTLSCKNSNRQKIGNAAQQSPQTEKSVQQEPQFPYPKIPESLKDPESRKTFLLAHYWDEFNFADTALVNNSNVTEQGFVDHIALLADTQTNPDEAEPSIGNLCRLMYPHPHARQVFMKLFDDYLSDPNSPFYNERLYAAYLKQMIGKYETDEAVRENFKFRLDLISRNQPGKQASDFTYYLPSGKTSTLKNTQVHNNRLLLVFYDPECPTCHHLLQEMINDESLKRAVDANKLSILAVYTEENMEAWRNSLKDMPANWIIGTDKEIIRMRALYNIKSMPSLYLLDGNKNVILKDATYEQIHSELGL